MTSPSPAGEQAAGPSLAVVIPTVGRAEIERALASVRHQAFAPEQVIVVDNGPLEPGVAERTAHLVSRFGDLPGFAVVSLPPRSGQSIARNFGAWNATTSHVAFLDDDDEFAPDYLYIMARHIAQFDPDVLYATMSIHDADGTHLRDKRLDTHERSAWLHRMYAQKNDGFSGQNVVVRRTTLLDLGGFPVDLRTAEDRLFAIRAILAGMRIDYVEKAVVHVHVPAGQRSRAEPTRWQACLKILVEYWHDMPWRVRWTSTRKTFKAWAIWIVKRRRMRRDDRRSPQ